MDEYKDKNQEPIDVNEPETAYGNSADALKALVVERVQHIQDVNILESILSFIKKKVERQDNIPNEETLAALREAESDADLSTVDTSSVEAMIASILQ